MRGTVGSIPARASCANAAAPPPPRHSRYQESGRDYQAGWGLRSLTEPRAPVPPRSYRPMSPQHSLLRHKDDDDEELMAAIDKRRRWMNRFDLWLFVSLWVAITTVAGLG